ncbi:MAG TPA: hypothetical protein VL251_01265 [Thermomonas sp.]|nr:hypothetical protein [Thermomonas sp.]
MLAALALLSLAAAQTAPAAPSSAPAAAPVEYADARRLADADEGSVTGATHAAMLAGQERLLREGVVACALGVPQRDFSAFTIVLRLDAQGRVAQAWRQGGSPLAICLQRYVRDKQVFVPPRAPFYASLEVSFTP